MSSLFQSVRRACFLSCALAGAMAAFAQEPATKPENGSPASEKPTPARGENRSTPGEQTSAKVEEKAALPFQIELLETHVRFETNGDSRKDVHTIVKMNDPAGARQFSRLGFDYNRGFQAVEIPLVKITHANGGTSEILPSAIADMPNPAVEKFPGYHDVRVKWVRILGLQDGDTLEYRVITTTTKPPLAPDFWLEHTFDRSGQVAEEHYELDLPKRPELEVRINPQAPTTGTEPAGNAPRTIYRWLRKYADSKAETSRIDSSTDSSAAPDISLSTFGWEYLSVRLDEMFLPGSKPLAEMKTYEDSMKEMGRQPEVAPEVRAKALSLSKDSMTELERLRAIYEFVSTQIRTVDLPLGATGFAVRPAAEVLKDGYANAEDKYVLFAALAQALKQPRGVALTGYCDKKAPAIPTKFRHLLILVYAKNKTYWLDPSLEVAPFGLIPPAAEKCAFVLNRGFYALNSTGHEWAETPPTLPFDAFQKVDVEASLSLDGTLKARLKYITRGENELVLREAFHQTPRERWNEVAGLLALADGFRGEITQVTASDPMQTKDPFTVEYEITQPKFVDWSKKSVRIPALLPQIALPDAPGKSAGGKIELGTPLEVETRLTLRLPEGTAVQTPPGTSVERDYAAYSSKYDGHLNTLTATRHIHFLMREMPGERAADYSAFVRAVQADQAQVITLFPNSEKK